MRKSLLLVVASLVTLLLLAGFTHPGGDVPVPRGQQSKALPACADVWRAGAPLPVAYQGCVDDENTRWPVILDRCEGGGYFTSWDDRFYALLGKTIHTNVGELTEDTQYAKMLKDCRGAGGGVCAVTGLPIDPKTGKSNPVDAALFALNESGVDLARVVLVK